MFDMHITHLCDVCTYFDFLLCRVAECMYKLDLCQHFKNYSCICLQGNMQRCKLVMDQVTEARDTMMKVLEHKEKVLKLLNKNGTVKKSSKLKRKERA